MRWSPTRGSGVIASPPSGFRNLSTRRVPRRPVNLMNAASASNENFSQAELDKFGALAQRWWDPEGPQKALHALNPARLGYVADRVTLQGSAVLDVGCGAGLLSEALARNGAGITARIARHQYRQDRQRRRPADVE